MSPGSSSTSSTSTTSHPSRLIISALVLGQHGQGKAKPGAGGGGFVQPDPAAVVLDDLLDHGQADSCAGVGRPVVEALEDHKDPVGVLGVDPDAVVGEREQPVPAVTAGRDRDPRRLVTAE